MAASDVAELVGLFTMSGADFLGDGLEDAFGPSRAGSVRTA
jgi:hypothetical protein